MIARSAAPDHQDRDPEVRVVWSTSEAYDELDRLLRGWLVSSPLGPITVVCPDALTSVVARRRGARLQVDEGRQGLCGVAFTTPVGLAKACAGHGSAVLRPATLRAAARGVISDRGHELRLVDHASSREAAVAVYRDLARVSPPDLARLRSVVGAEAALAVYADMSARLGADRSDADVLQMAQRGLPRHRNGLGPVVWWCPASSSWLEERWMAAVMASGPGAIVFARSGLTEPDRAVIETVARFAEHPPSVELPAAQDGPGASAGPTAPAGPAKAGSTVAGSRPRVMLASLTDADAEVRLVVRQVCEWIRAGVEPTAIAVAVPLEDPYGRSVRRQLAAAGIASLGPSAETIGSSLIGRALRRALDLPRSNWSRNAVIELLVDLPDVTDTVPRSVLWEQLSRDAGIVDGLSAWTTMFDDLADRAASVSERAQCCRRWIETVASALDEVRIAPAGELPWARVADALVGLCDALVVDVPLDDPSEAMVVEQVSRLLHRLRDLDRLGFACSDADVDDAIEGILAERRSTAGGISDGVVVAPPAVVGRMPVSALAVVGAAEGVLAASPRADALLPKAVRHSVPSLCRDDAANAAVRGLALALRGAATALVTIPTGDLRGRRRHLPSRWLEQLLPDDSCRLDHRSDRRSLLGSRVVATPIDAVRRSLQAGVGPTLERWSRLDPEEATALLGPAAVRHLDRVATATSHRRQGLVGEWTGFVGLGDQGSELGVTSATALERWASCGYRYFLSDRLRVGQLAEPERLDEFGPREVGIVVHEMLEQFGRHELTSTPVAAARFADDFLDAVPSRAHVGRSAAWAVTRRSIRTTFLAIVDAAAAWSREEGSQLAAVEFGFGVDEPCSIDTAAGSIEVRGRVDRVESSPERVLAADYKIGRTARWRTLRADPFDRGRHLQLAIYAEAVGQRMWRADRAVRRRAEYWVIDPQRPTDGCERIGIDWDDGHRERFRTILAAITSAIRAGEFPMVPGSYNAFLRSYDNCRHCPYELVCSTDRDAAPELSDSGDGFPLTRHFEVVAGNEVHVG